MNDSYVELLVKRRTGTAAVVLRGIFIAIGIMLCILAAVTTTLFAVLGIVFFGLAYLARLNSQLEYEYLYMDKQLTIDRILGQTRRKNVAEYNLSGMEILAPSSSNRLDTYRRSSQLKVRDFSAKEPEGTPYSIVFSSGGQYEEVRIEMNDELMKMISLTAPRKVFKD